MNLSVRHPAVAAASDLESGKAQSHYSRLKAASSVVDSVHADVGSLLQRRVFERILRLDLFGTVYGLYND